jgi:4'-phosphopantetheinyl transferase
MLTQPYSLVDQFPSLGPGEVHVWLASLSVSLDVEQYLKEMLPEHELNRAQRFHFEHDRRRFIVAHGILRSILSDYVKQPAGELIFQHNKYGKPSLASSDIVFNLSHSDEFALCAVSRSGAVGVDIEFIRDVKDWEEMSTFIFTSCEREELYSLPPEERLIGFFSGWTRKEAIVKAIGHGLSVPLSSFSVTIAPEGPARVTDMSNIGSWRLIELPAIPSYSTALAVDIYPIVLSCFQWHFEM